MASSKDYKQGYANLNKGLWELNETSTEKDVELLYDDWAATYEKNLVEAQFIGIKPIAESFDTSLAASGFNKAARIMDAAAGTGLVGLELSKLGYTNMDAMDISQKMLDEAEKKKIYKKLICAPLGKENLPGVEENEYDGLIVSGALFVSHVKPEALDEVVRIIKPGGVASFNIREDVLAHYQPKIKELEARHKWQFISKTTVPQYATPGMPRESSLYAFKVTIA